jgi:phytanoyl-CoA hydroxylase
MAITDPTQLTSSGIGPQAVNDYQERGAILVPNLFTQDEIAQIRNDFTAHAEKATTNVWVVDGKVIDDNISPDDILYKYPRYVMPHRHPEMKAGQVARQLMMDQRLTEVAENLIGPVYGAQSMFYFKPPKARGQAMHQDNMSLQAHPETCLAAWISIDDADAENGGLMIIPGSHRNDLLCLEEADSTQSFVKSTVRIPANVNTIQTNLKAGDVLFFHGNLVHGSLPNSTKDRFRRVSAGCMWPQVDFDSYNRL